MNDLIDPRRSENYPDDSKTEKVLGTLALISAIIGLIFKLTDSDEKNPFDFQDWRD